MASDMNLLFGGEMGGDAFSGEDVGQALGVAAVGDVDFDPCLGGEFHGFEFRTHPAHGEFSFVVTDVAEGGVDVGNFGDELVGGRVEQAVDAGEQDHATGADQFRDVNREHVVVPEAEFADRDRIVFVDDREDAGFLEEAVEGVEKISGAGFRLDVLGGEEDLGDEDVEIGKQGAVGAHQAGLADCGAGLAGGDVAGVFGQAHGGNARTNGAGGDEEAAVAFVDEFGNGGDQMHERRAIDRAVGGFGENAGSGFDNGEVAGHGRSCGQEP